MKARHTVSPTPLRFFQKNVGGLLQARNRGIGLSTRLVGDILLALILTVNVLLGLLWSDIAILCLHGYAVASGTKELHLRFICEIVMSQKPCRCPVTPNPI